MHHCDNCYLLVTNLGARWLIFATKVHHPIFLLKFSEWNLSNHKVLIPSENPMFLGFYLKIWLQGKKITINNYPKIANASPLVQTIYNHIEFFHNPKKCNNQMVTCGESSRWTDTQYCKMDWYTELTGPFTRT